MFATAGPVRAVCLYRMLSVRKERKTLISRVEPFLEL